MICERKKEGRKRGGVKSVLSEIFDKVMKKYATR
jgi:hypothetical protein